MYGWVVYYKLESKSPWHMLAVWPQVSTVWSGPRSQIFKIRRTTGTTWDTTAIIICQGDLIPFALIQDSLFGRYDRRTTCVYCEFHWKFWHDHCRVCVVCIEAVYFGPLCEQCETIRGFPKVTVDVFKVSKFHVQHNSGAIIGKTPWPLTLTFLFYKFSIFIFVFIL